jgi:hypothetical protein
MNRRTIWSTVVVASLLGAVMAVAILGGQGAAPTKKGRAAGLALPGATSVAAAGRGAAGKAAEGPSIGEPTLPASFDGDVRDLPAIPANPIPVVELDRPTPAPGKAAYRPNELPSTPAQTPGMPAPTQNFAGLSFTDPVTGGTAGAGYPPDTEGDVGPNHYIQAVNTAIAIYNKTGTRLAAFTFNSLFTGANPPCDTSNFGDPTVVYDPMANRWFVADFSWSNLQNGPYYECIAVSKTADPVAGGWWLYTIRADDAARPYFTDYPKMGIWPDGLYISYNTYDCLNADCSSATNHGFRAQALSRTALEAGAAVFTISFDREYTGCFSADPCYFGAIPSNVRGSQLPPAGRENLYASQDQLDFSWEIWKFHVDFANPGLSTFTGPTNVAQANYGCCTFPRVATPSAANSLDSLADRLMKQNQYRNIGGVESLWLAHTVPINNNTLPLMTQWAQINVTGGTISTPPVQSQIYGNLGSDGLSRWMASVAVDNAGNMAMGYSAANANVNPQIRYNGRLAGDPLNTLPQGESTIVAGGGTQTNNCGGQPCHRWGDYSSMSLDPNGCTFWYTTEYYVANGGNWNTRIAAFQYPGVCAPTAAGLVAFAATRTGSRVAVTWRTGTETQALGFNVFRRGVKLNRSLIPARYAGQARGALYRFVDRTARGRATYRLQLVQRSGKTVWYGASASVR